MVGKVGLFENSFYSWYRERGRVSKRVTRISPTLPTFATLAGEGDLGDRFLDFLGCRGTEI
jgi:hypothetical protein